MDRASLSILGAALLNACTARVSYECKSEFRADCETVEVLRDEIAAATASPPDPETICRIADRAAEKIFGIFASHPWQETTDDREDIFDGQPIVSKILLPAYPGYDRMGGMQCFFQQDDAIRDTQAAGCRLDSGETGFTPNISFQATNGPVHATLLPYYNPSIGAGICSNGEVFRKGGCTAYRVHLGAKDIDNSGPESAAILDDPDNPSAHTECPTILMDEVMVRIERIFDFVRGKIRGI